MGLRDILTGRHEVKGPAPRPPVCDLHRLHRAADRAQHRAGGRAAIVFQALQTSEFEAVIKEMEEVVVATGGESGTKVHTAGRQLRLPLDGAARRLVEDLAVGINAVSSSIESAGHGERLLCAVFAFKDAKRAPVYFIYNYKRGFWYPFVPASRGGLELDQADERSTERELQLKAQMASELPIEPELERWFPLWGIPI